MARPSALPVLYFRKLPLPRAFTANFSFLVARRTSAVVLKIPGQVMKVCGWFVAVLRTAETFRAAKLWAGPGWGRVWSLSAALFAWFLIRPRDALQSFGATEPKMGQERELKLEPLAAVWT